MSALVAVPALALTVGGTTAALADGGGHGHKTVEKAHCVTVQLSGSTPVGYGDKAETYSATATATVCETKETVKRDYKGEEIKGGVISVTVAGAAASETEAKQHGGK
jgi:hypothetical protein